MTWRSYSLVFAVGLALTAASCASSASHLDDLRGELGRVDARFEPREPEAERPDPAFEGHLEGYTAYAMAQSPALQASYEAWRAAIHKVGAADKLPEPTLTYGLFLRRVETRVGAQRHRFGLRVPFPWPSKLDAGVDAAAASATAAQRRFEAEALLLHRRIGEAYWSLWSIHRTREVNKDLLALIQQLAGSARARLEIGRATVGDLSQIELKLSQLEDAIRGLDEAERIASSRLLALAGAPPDAQAPVTSDAFRSLRATEADDVLRAEAREHPSAEALAMLAVSSRADAARADAARYPDFTFGLDYIETGELEGANPPDNGKDPIMAVLGLKLPVWSGAYEAQRSEAQARSRSFEHQRTAVQDALEAQVIQTLAQIRDTARRIALFEDTLIPQAETAYGSALGTYEVGGSVATVLLAYRELLDLRLGLVAARADHARAWARLEGAVGRSVASEEIP